MPINKKALQMQGCEANVYLGSAMGSLVQQYKKGYTQSHIFFWKIFVSLGMIYISGFEIIRDNFNKIGVSIWRL